MGSTKLDLDGSELDAATDAVADSEALRAFLSSADGLGF